MGGMGGGGDLYNRTFNLKDDAYILLTFGDVYADSTVIEKNKVLPIRSVDPIDFTENKQHYGRSLTNEHVAHISLGLISRLVITGILILIPRYFRAPLQTPAKRDIPKWALIHRF